MKPTSSQSDLTLLVQQEGRIDQEVFLQHGITIGRAASNMICIEDPEVEHIHARVLRQADGSFILQAEDRATFQAVSSEDGSTQTTDKAALQADLVLQIGKTKITCRQQKTHASAILAESLWEAACPRCQSVISDQAEAEQTCSSCSLPLFHHESKEFTGWLPRKVGPYEIRKFVAKGGMGVVLRGIHEESDQVAAIKLPHPELVKDERWARRFEGEIKTLARLVHPNLVRLQASGREDALMWLAMDWVEGESLSGKIGGGLGVEEVRSLMEQAVRGLGVLHGKGIIHRDLKPSNLLVGADGALKLADFGLAKAVEGEESMLTRTGTLAGTGPYMAPEQWQGLELSEATDVYALGIIWHELLTGKRPQLGEVNIGGDPSGWGKMIKVCLEQNPLKRPGLREIQSSLGGNIDWGKGGETSAVPRKAGRRLMPWAAMLVLGAVVGLGYWMSKGPVDETKSAGSIEVAEESKPDTAKAEEPTEQRPTEVVERSEPEPEAPVQTTIVTEPEAKPEVQEPIEEEKPIRVVKASEPEPEKTVQPTIATKTEIKPEAQELLEKKKPIEVVTQSESKPKPEPTPQSKLVSLSKRGNLLWDFETEAAVRSSPAIGVDGTVYVGSNDKKVYALAGKTGAIRWYFETGDAVSSSPAIGSDGTVYVGSIDNKVYALDGKSGAKKWELKTESLVSSSPAIGTDGTVYVGSFDEKLYAINGKTGTEQWKFDIGALAASSLAIGADRIVYSVAVYGKVYALNDKTGTKHWEFEIGGPVYSSPAIGSDGTVYVGSTDKKVYALDGETGTKQWEFETGGAVESSPAIGSDGTVYVGSIDEKLYAINGKSGVKLWEFRTGGAVESSPAIGNDGTVYVGSNDNKIYALDGETGTKQWEFETGGAVEASPAIGADGTVYVGSDDGKVYALATSSSGPAKSAWPMFGQNAQRTGRAIGQAETKRQAALNNPQTKLSGRTSVDVPLGRYASANYESFIRRKYMDATIHPGAISGDPVVKVRLVIARNGRILSARVTVKSGVASWDRSVQKALDRVKFIKPFPESMKGSQQTFNLNFNSRSFN